MAPEPVATEQPLSLTYLCLGGSGRVRPTAKVTRVGRTAWAALDSIGNGLLVLL